MNLSWKERLRKIIFNVISVIFILQSLIYGDWEKGKQIAGENSRENSIFEKKPLYARKYLVSSYAPYACMHCQL